MLRQSSSRSHRSKKLKPSDTLQAVLLVAVGVWILYQLTRSYSKQRVVAVETDGEPARRWLGRKGFVDLAAGQASADDIVWAGGGSHVGRGDADSSDDHLSQAVDGDEDQEADGDDGVYSDADDVGGGLATDEEEDGTDFQSQSDSNEDELNTAQGQSQNGLNVSVVPPVNATNTIEDGGAVLPVKATGGSALKNNTSSSHDLSLHGRGTAGDVSSKLLANNGSSPGENQRLQINRNGTAHSVAGHVIP